MCPSTNEPWKPCAASAIASTETEADVVVASGRLTSLQARVTALSTLLFALALIVAEVALVVILRRQLIAEVDRSVDARLFDLLDFVNVIYDVEDLDDGDRLELQALGGGDEIAALYNPDGDIISISDSTGSAARLFDLAQDLLAKTEAENITVSLNDFVETSDTSSMRFGANGLVEETFVLDGRLLSDDEAFDLTDEQAERAIRTETVFEIAVVAKSLRGVDRTVSTITAVLAIATPLLLALFAALAWWLAGRTLRPVERTRREVEEISAGDLERRISTSGRGDEIDRLAATMNDMLARIEAGQTQQRHFVADASHELRTPLAAIATELDVAAAHPETATWPDTAHRLRATVSRMQRLVDDLQLLARSDAGVAAAPDTTAVALGDLVLESAYGGGSGAPVTLGHVDDVSVQGNADQLQRIIDNLIANARRHANDRVHVSLSTDANAGVAEMRVDDDGTGIEPADRARVFERFVRLDEGRSRDRGGSGLGLAICHELVAAHQGTITVEQAELGGASFVVRLPLAG